MDNLKKTGVLKNDPTVTKNRNISFATFSFYACTLDANGKAVTITPAEMVYVVAFGGIASFVESSLRKGSTVTVLGHRDSTGKASESTGQRICTNMVADEINIVSGPGHADRTPQPLKKTEGALCREEYEANGGFRERKPVLQSWEEGEEVEDFHNE